MIRGMIADMNAEEFVASLGIAPEVVGERLHELRSHVAAEVAALDHARRDGRPVIPEIDMADVVAGSVPAAIVADIHRRGCVVVRSTFERTEAEAWDAEVARYLMQNGVDPAPPPVVSDDDAPPRPPTGIRGIYWSRAQVAARQHPAMATVRSFLNRLWSLDAPGGPWLDPDTDIAYPDRLRRRPPGVAARGLSMHVDTPAAGGWRLVENQRVFAPLLSGGLEAFDPWSPAHRTGIDPVVGVESPVGSTVFRTFQGWAALSEMHPSDGVLHLVPIPLAVAYRLVAGLAGELGLVGDPEPAPRRDDGDDLVARGLVPIPPVRPGDTVWWHGDLYHCVADASNDERWGNVLYIGAAPLCERNAAYRADAYDRFVRGASPRDFPDEHAELAFVGRAGPGDLSDLGWRQFGVDPPHAP
jgi:hypothetical protein